MNKNVYFTNTFRFPFLGLLCPCQCFDQMDTVYNNDKYIIIFSFLRGSSLEFYSLVTTWILKGINEREGLWPRRMHSGSWCTAAAAAAVVHQGAGCADPCTPRSTFLQVGIHPVAAACARPCALNALQSAVLLFLPHPSLLLLLFLLLLLQWLQSCISSCHQSTTPPFLRINCIPRENDKIEWDTIWRETIFYQHLLARMHIPPDFDEGHFS